MKNLEKIGTLQERVSGCELRVQIKVGELIWHMYSDKTGYNYIIQKIESGMGAPRPDKRVRTHWDGFLANQTK